MKISLFYVTHKNHEEAKKVADHLMNLRIIACFNVFPVASSYWWNGKIETTDEAVTILKTKSELVARVEEEILKIHSYETPCIIHYEAEVNESYGNWIVSETSNH